MTSLLSICVFRPSSDCCGQGHRSVRYHIGAFDALPFKTILVVIGKALACNTLLEDDKPESIAVNRVHGLCHPILRDSVPDSPGLLLQTISRTCAAMQQPEPMWGKRIDWNARSVDIREFLNESIDPVEYGTSDNVKRTSLMLGSCTTCA